jgi:hypothetical protein
MTKTKVAVLLLSAVLLSACGIQKSPLTGGQAGDVVGKCQQGSVDIAGYGDKGKRLENCFVEYPGEPSRMDKSYFVIEDVCGQFTKEFVQNALGKPIIKAEPPEIASLFNCRYYINDKDYVLLIFEYLKIANQKIGQEAMGRRTEESDKIPMRNLLAWQEDGALNNIYLVLGEDKFLSIDRSSSSNFTSDELINFAANIAKEIKNYK